MAARKTAPKTTTEPEMVPAEELQLTEEQLAQTQAELAEARAKLAEAEKPQHQPLLRRGVEAGGEPAKMFTGQYDSGEPEGPMTVYATSKGYYGDRIREVDGVPFEIADGKTQFSHEWMSKEKPEIEEPPRYSSA